MKMWSLSFSVIRTEMIEMDKINFIWTVTMFFSVFQTSTDGLKKSLIFDMLIYHQISFNFLFLKGNRCEGLRFD